MTDKQMIIDGKECRYWFRPNPDDYRKCSLRGKNDNCDEIKDCFVKELLGKLALKEQECEELKKQLERKEENYQKLLSKSNKYIYNLVDENVQDISNLARQLKQLKAKLEQEKALKETYLACYKAKHDDIDGELLKLKQTLAEIKEIAEYCYDPVDKENDGFWSILQKISECEVKNERNRKDV